MEKNSAQLEDDLARLVSRNKDGAFTSLIQKAEAAVAEQNACVKAVRDWLPTAEGAPRELAVEEDIFNKGAELRSQFDIHTDSISVLKSQFAEAMKIKN